LPIVPKCSDLSAELTYPPDYIIYNPEDQLALQKDLNIISRNIKQSSAKYISIYWLYPGIAPGWVYFFQPTKKPIYSKVKMLQTKKPRNQILETIQKKFTNYFSTPCMNINTPMSIEYIK